MQVPGHGRQLPRRSVLGALAGSLGVLAGCGSSAPSGPPVGSPRFGRNATGVVRFWDRNATAPYGQALAEEFNRAHPRLRVEVSAVQDTQYVTKLATAIRSGSQPDLVGIDDINSQLFIYNKAFLDLTPVVRALPFREHLSPGALNLTTENGRYYGTPYAADLSVMFYNKTLFRRAGLDPGKPPKNFQQILAAARAVRKLGSDTYGFYFSGRSEGTLGFTILPQVWATGSRLIRGEPGHQRITITGNKPLRRALDLYRTLWSEGLASPKSETETGATGLNDFIAGKIGMVASSVSGLATATPEFLKQVGAFPLPGPDGGYGTFDGGANFGIPKNAENASGAWEFIRFALEKKQQSAAPDSGFSPIRNDVVTAEFRHRNPLDVVAVDALGHGYAPKTIAYNVTFNQPGGPWLTMFLRAVFDGDVDGAMAAGQSAFTDALEQAQA